MALGGTPSAKYALAVSGGPDSLALLALASAAFPGKIAALSVDHRMRAEAARECADVATICHTLGVPHTTLTVRAIPRSQADARTCRYRLMGDWCRANGYHWLLTAHHQDDQAETVLLRLLRGSGLKGLAGMRPVRRLDNAEPTIFLMRPLLSVSRAALAEITARTGWPVAHDPSNRNPHYDRTRVRRLLAQNPQLAPARLAQVARLLRSEEYALDWATNEAFAARVTFPADGGLMLDVEALPPALKRRLLIRAFESLGHPAAESMETLLARLANGEKANMAGLLVDPVAPERWRIRPEPPRKPCRDRPAKP